ncbi:hypothetical protein [Bdellovibrio sp. HCB337]|uniref:hypothetical protein n=1 Tax=Bdellovibrio sp. HCB337 TaxID=3394358 RepID=UPI0039A40C4A
MKRITLSLLTIMTAACTTQFQPSENVTAVATSEAVMNAPVDLNLHPLNKTVCDPFNDNSTQVMSQGVMGTLFYKTAAMPRMYSAIDFTTLTQKSDKTLFFADMNVPTRPFSDGFSTQTTGVLADDTGSKLIEYFGIKFETTLQLSDADEEGDYELALLSDDGTRLKIKDPMTDTWREIINNDGDHSTRMGCATETIRMTRRTQIPLEVIYYQGPRLHIANVLIWRKASQAGKDIQCGTAGNKYFFDPDNGSTPLQVYNEMQSRGWKPVAPANFWLDNTYNPCAQGTKPLISNFRVTEIIATDVFLAWTTDIPASSQVRLINQATGEEILTSSDNLLRTTHSIHVSGLQPNTTYKAQAASISQDLGNSLSLEVTFTTK